MLTCLLTTTRGGGRQGEMDKWRKGRMRKKALRRNRNKVMMQGKMIGKRRDEEGNVREKTE